MDPKAKKITYKIKEAIPQADNSYLLVVSLSDGKGSWTKSYKFSNSNVIKLDRVKETIEADVRKDLKAENPLSEVKPALNQEFSFNI